MQQNLIWGEDLETYLLSYSPLHFHGPVQGFVDLQLRKKTQNSLTFSSSILPFQPQGDVNRLATIVHGARGKRLQKL